MPSWRFPLIVLLCLSPGSVRGEVLPDVLPTGGINLADYTYFDHGPPFIDYAKMGRDWLSSDGNIWSDERPLSLTPLGYPASLLEDQIARTLMFTHNDQNYNTGDYYVTWEGTGDVRMSSAAGSVQTLSIDQNQALYHVSATEDIGLLLEIWKTDPADPVHNIRVIEDQYRDQTSPFHPQYVRDLQNYGVLRFMNWLPTNGNWVTDWANRAQLDQAHWGHRQGIPYEMQIALGNELHQDIWLTIPHAASDDYIQQLAQLVDDQLDPSLRVWVEYTNEAWNAAFPQYDYINDVLTAQYGTRLSSEAYALRAGEIFDLVGQVLPPERMIRVVGGWAQNPFVLYKELPLLTDGDGVTNGDVATIAAYFGLTDNQMDRLYASYTKDQVDLDLVFSTLQTNIDQAAKQWKENHDIAAGYGLPLVSYEGGQHIVSNDAGQRADGGFVALLEQIQRDPRMGDMYDHLAEKWREIGGTTLTWYTNMDPWSNSGSWGLKEGFDDPVAPKFDSVQEYLLSHLGGWDLRNQSWLGDLNGNGTLDVEDIDFLSEALVDGETNEALDLNRDGQVDEADHQFWVSQLAQTYPGDTDLDGIFSTNDLILALQAGTYEDLVPRNAGWGSGDWNGDQEFDSSDLIAVMASGGLQQLQAQAAVPEPSGAGLLCAALASITAWAGRRRKARCGCP